MCIQGLLTKSYLKPTKPDDSESIIIISKGAHLTVLRRKQILDIIVF